MFSKTKDRIREVLKWSEKYTKTDMLYVAQGGLWLGFGQVVTSASVFFLSVAFANLLDPEIYGIYKYVLSLYGLLIITTLTGMDSAVTQSVACGYEGSISNAIKTKIKWGLLGTLVSIGIAIYYYYQGNITLTLSFSVVALFLPFIESFDVYNSLLFGKKLFSVQTRYNTLKNVIGLVAVSLTIFSTGNVYLILLVYFTSLLLPNIVFLYRAQKRYKNNNVHDPGVITYGKHLSAVAIIGTIVGNLDKILVFQYIGAANLAIYTLAMAPTDQIKGLLKNINTLAMPKFSQRSAEDIKKMVWSKVFILFIITAGIVGAYILIAPYFFQFFFPKYMASVAYSQVLALSLIIVVLSGFLYTVLEAQKLSEEIYKYNIFSSLLHIAILIPLIYFFGVWGAVASRIITRLFSFGLISGYIRKL